MVCCTLLRTTTIYPPMNHTSKSSCCAPTAPRTRLHIQIHLSDGNRPRCICSKAGIRLCLLVSSLPKGFSRKVQRDKSESMEVVKSPTLGSLTYAIYTDSRTERRKRLTGIVHGRAILRGFVRVDYPEVGLPGSDLGFSLR
jgi:hypothetical protein